MKHPVYLDPRTDQKLILTSEIFKHAFYDEAYFERLGGEDSIGNAIHLDLAYGIVVFCHVEFDYSFMEHKGSFIFCNKERVYFEQQTGQKWTPRHQYIVQFLLDPNDKGLYAIPIYSITWKKLLLLNGEVMQ